MSNESEKTRRYRKRRRAEQEARTRLRITEAAVKLHGTIGPAETTVSGIAREAGVQRATVYRHFPDEEAIFDACTSHYNSLHPPPDFTRWASVADTGERLRVALGELYGFYAETQHMLELSGRDMDRVPALRKTADAYEAYQEAARSVLMKGRPERGGGRERVSAALGHALAFSTWRSLVGEQGLGEADAVDLMVALVASAP
jgi:AcrR family transcriptional regulator